MRMSVLMTAAVALAFVAAGPAQAGGDAAAGETLAKKKPDLLVSLGGLGTDEAAIAQLQDEDVQLVDSALAVLFVVGRVGDAAAVEPLLEHPVARIRKAAQTCEFEIRRRFE